MRVGRAAKLSSDEGFAVACGQCIHCRLNYARSWALRAQHEALSHEHSSFLTLTYDEEHVPEDGGLRKRDVQLFLKRLRKALPNKIRYLYCGEYGERTARPHYHMLLFGEDFRKDSTIERSKSGEDAWSSPLLEKTWGMGMHQVGSLTFDSACYVARYATKKKTGLQAVSEYQRVSPLTGEVWQVPPPFIDMSRRPGIGKEFYAAYKNDLYPHDYAVAKGGARFPVPAYYDRLLAQEEPELLEELKTARRQKAAAAGLEDEGDDRRATRAKCAHARMSLFGREPS